MKTKMIAILTVVFLVCPVLCRADQAAPQTSVAINEQRSPTGDYWISDGAFALSPRQLDRDSVVEAWQWMSAQSKEKIWQQAALEPQKKRRLSVSLTSDGKRRAVSNTFEEYGQVLSLNLVNNTDEEISDFVGFLLIKDNVGDRVFLGLISVPKTIPANGSIVWEALVKTNEFSDSYAQLYNTPGSSLSLDAYEEESEDGESSGNSSL